MIWHMAYIKHIFTGVLQLTEHLMMGLPGATRHYRRTGEILSWDGGGVTNNKNLQHIQGAKVMREIPSCLVLWRVYAQLAFNHDNGLAPSRG